MRGAREDNPDGIVIVERIRLDGRPVPKKAINEVKAWLAIGRATASLSGTVPEVWGCVKGTDEHWERVLDIRVKKGRAQALYDGRVPGWGAIDIAAMSEKKVPDTPELAPYTVFQGPG